MRPPLSWPLLVMLGAISAGAGAAPHNLAIRGADVSTLAELERLGVHYQDGTRQGDLLTLMRSVASTWYACGCGSIPVRPRGNPLVVATMTWKR